MSKRVALRILAESGTLDREAFQVPDLYHSPFAPDLTRLHRVCKFDLAKSERFGVHFNGF
jgi:hypothetical protein